MSNWDNVHFSSDPKLGDPHIWGGGQAGLGDLCLTGTCLQVDYENWV